jgi:hypothetical protein
MQRTPLVAAILVSAVVGTVVVGFASTADASGDVATNRGWETSSKNRGWGHDEPVALAPIPN